MSDAETQERVELLTVVVDELTTLLAIVRAASDTLRETKLEPLVALAENIDQKVAARCPFSMAIIEEYQRQKREAVN